MTTQAVDDGNSMLRLIRKAASKAVAEEDVWSKYNIPSIPAEYVIRHLYNPLEQKWESDETIVKIEKEPFTHGAMRYCFRMKKKAALPASTSNHRFHNCGWTRASNYVAKAYMTKNNSRGDIIVVDCSDEAKQAVKNDIILQYEAMHWANKFNDLKPPRSIVFLRAYAMEFPRRPGKPWFAVERFISGNDEYGAGFVKHNTNSGFVDTELRRKTPQVFSAFSFYASQGTRLVADIQGVGDLYTDPQVLSCDYRFGDGDLGYRGMALFFHSFRHCSLSDFLGIPIFALSKNEVKNQPKYDEDDQTLSSDESESGGAGGAVAKERRSLLRLDLNRLRRKSLLMAPSDLMVVVLAEGEEDPVSETMPTAKRSNMTHLEMRSSLKNSMRMSTTSKKKSTLVRTKSDVDEIGHCLLTAVRDTVFDYHTFHRKASGELRERGSEAHKDNYRKDLKPAPPLVPSELTKANLGKVHYHLACLHGLNRFSEMESECGDIASVIFHLAHASSLRCAEASLALGRVRAGLGSYISPHLPALVPIDFDSAKELLQRAMESGSHNSAKTRAAAGCILLQILQEEEGTTDVTLQNFMEETLDLIVLAEKEEQVVKAHKEQQERGGVLCIGDCVEANYCMEGTFYPGVVISIDNDSCTVQYNDDGSSETLPLNEVRPLSLPCATQRILSDDCLTDAEALGLINEDEDCLLEKFVLQAELAEIKARLGFAKEAAILYEQAAEGAMNAGKMMTASQCSQKAAILGVGVH